MLSLQLPTQQKIVYESALPYLVLAYSVRTRRTIRHDTIITQNKIIIPLHATENYIIMHSIQHKLSCFSFFLFFKTWPHQRETWLMKAKKGSKKSIFRISTTTITTTIITTYIENHFGFQLLGYDYFLAFLCYVTRGLISHVTHKQRSVVCHQ